MRIAIASDHRGIALRTSIQKLLESWGHSVLDEGTCHEDKVDYPDYAAAVAGLVMRGEADRGVLVCGTGIGMAIAANKFPGVRASVCCDLQTAEASRRHNDLNVLCIGADSKDSADWAPLIQVWLETEFEGGRHAARLEKIRQLERQFANTRPDSARNA